MVTGPGPQDMLRMRCSPGTFSFALQSSIFDIQHTKQVILTAAGSGISSSGDSLRSVITLDFLVHISLQNAEHDLL
jgi:hypothetical protein